jgi:hypothetical protein
MESGGVFACFPIDLASWLRLDNGWSGGIMSCAIWESWRYVPR